MSIVVKVILHRVEIVSLYGVLRMAPKRPENMR